MDERLRIKQVLGGDISAFNYFVETYQDMAMTIAYRVMKNRQDAEDVTQNAFIRAYQNLYSFKQNSKFSSWFYRIVYTMAISELRKPRYKKEIEAIERVATSVKTNANQYEAIEEKHRANLIEKALSALPASESVILSLYYLEELSVSNVAEIVGLTKSNVKIKLHRGREKLREILGEYQKNK